MANLCPPGVWFADQMSWRFSLVLRLFCFASFSLYAFFVGAAALRSIVLRYASSAPIIATRVYFPFFGHLAFSEYFLVPFPLALCMESTSYVLSFRMVVFFYLVTTGWIFDISLFMWEFNQSDQNHGDNPLLNKLGSKSRQNPCQAPALAHCELIGVKTVSLGNGTLVN